MQFKGEREMGFFSKCCVKTNLPIVHSMRGYPELNRVVALMPGGKTLEGSYDGYGRVDGVSVVDDWDETKFVLARAYNDEAYDDLPKSYDEMGQGHFMADAFLDYCLEKGHFNDREEYTQAFNKLANW
jgi:hypothetical protein